jgi:hypothetical protein
MWQTKHVQDECLSLKPNDQMIRLKEYSFCLFKIYLLANFASQKAHGFGFFFFGKLLLVFRQSLTSLEVGVNFLQFREGIFSAHTSK